MTQVRVSAVAGFLAGLLAATFMALSTLAMRVLLGAPSTLEILADGVIGIVPTAYFASLLDSLQQAAKPVLYGILLIGQLLAGGTIGQWYARHQRGWQIIALTLGLWLGLYLVVFPLLGQGPFGSASRSDAPLIAISSLIAFTTFAVLLLGLAPRLSQTTPKGETLNRRAFLGWFGSAAGGLLAIAGGWRLVGSPTSSSTGSGIGDPGGLETHYGSVPGEPPFGVTGLPREVTPTGDFFVVSKNLSFLDPVVDPRTWQLRVDGLVERPLTLTIDDVARFPAVTDFYTLQCISNEVGGDLIGNAQWKGFRLADLLAEAQMKAGVRKVVFHCVDDYQVSIRPDRATHPDTLAAYEMNGAPLTKEHGAPLRIVVPGLYGMMNAKWVRRIELVNQDHKGYWQAKGWSDVALYQTTARIDVPRARPTVPQGLVTVGGIAFAGDRGLNGVEVSLDKGKTWLAAELKPPLGINAWGLWRYSWYPEPGSHTLHARAIDGLGNIQPAEVKGPLPDGATGHHDITIRVVAEAHKTSG